VPAAPAASCAKCVVSTRVSSPRSHRIHPAFPHAMVLTAYSVLSPVTGLSCHRRCAENSRELDASVGASGPHGFAVRNKRRSSARYSHAQRCRVHRIPPRVRDDRDTPLLGDETARDIVLIWVRRNGNIFQNGAGPLESNCILGGISTARLSGDGNLCPGLSCIARQRHADDGAGAELGAQPHRSAMQIGQRSRNRQSKP
jgi:hypothetical protein